MNFKAFLCTAAALWLFAANLAAIPPTESQQQQIDHPDAATSQKVDADVQALLGWYLGTAEQGYAVGRPLDAAETAFAQSIGISDPQQIRIVEADSVPYAAGPQEQEIFARYGIYSGGAGSVGLAINRTVFVKKDVANKPMVIKHELTHSLQIQKLGIAGFLRRYLLELKVVGYENSPLELEANKTMYRR